MAENQVAKGTGSIKRFEVKRLGYTIAFEISPDEAQCHCFYEPSTIGGTPITESELQGHLSQFKISEGILPESVVTLLISAASAKSVDGLLLALGIEMIPGEDGLILMDATDALAETQLTSEVEESGYAAVDFRRVQSFMNVEEGDRIASIKLPGLGKSGKTVTGKIIPPQAGVPVELVIGQKARLSEDGLTVFADGTGRVCLRENEISVEDIYEIAGDVDFKVGNISFKGYVEVKGDVLDGFFVKATKGIKIQGNIGVCTVESDGDITFCGMSGQGVGMIRCGGSIAANFISDAVVECAGNIVVEVEIRSSQIKCLGAILVNKGGLTGGEYFALAGIECNNLGSKTSLRTRVVAGVHYGDKEELNCLFNELKWLVAEFTAAPKGSVDMKEFAQSRAAITERTQEVRSRTHEQCNPKINVKKKLFDGVNITLGMISENITEERKGPISIIENTIEGGFRFLGMTALSFKAQMIEQTFIQQHLLEQQKIRSSLQGVGE